MRIMSHFSRLAEKYTSAAGMMLDKLDYYARFVAERWRGAMIFTCDTGRGADAPCLIYAAAAADAYRHGQVSP